MISLSHLLEVQFARVPSHSRARRLRPIAHRCCIPGPTTSTMQRHEMRCCRLAAQVVGFFVVEDRVQRGAAGLAAGAAMDAGWESAVAALKVQFRCCFWLSFYV